MAIQLGAAKCLGIVAVPDLDVIQPDCSVETLEGGVQALFPGNVISGDVSVAGVDARRDGDDSPQPIQQFGDLLEAASQRKLRPGGVLDENCQPAFCKIEPAGRGRDARGGAKQSLLAVASPK